MVRSVLASAFVLSLWACGDSGSGAGGAGGSADGGSTDGGASADGGAGGGTGGEPATCDPPEPQPGTPNDVPVDSVAIEATDEAGDPIAAVNLQLCGVDGCLYAMTDAAGQAIFINELSSETIDRPVSKPGDSLVYGKFAYPYTETSADPLLVVLPRMTDTGDQVEAGATLTAEGVEIEVGADTALHIDELTYDSEEKKTFRAAQVPAALVSTVTGSEDYVMAFALGPYDTLFCPPVAARFENYADLAPGTEVEIYGLELTGEESFGGYGEWSKIADGVVSADGTNVETDALPVLLSIAIKEK